MVLKAFWDFELQKFPFVAFMFIQCILVCSLSKFLTRYRTLFYYLEHNFIFRHNLAYKIYEKIQGRSLHFKLKKRVPQTLTTSTKIPIQFGWGGNQSDSLWQSADVVFWWLRAGGRVGYLSYWQNILILTLQDKIQHI